MRADIDWQPAHCSETSNRKQPRPPCPCCRGGERGLFCFVAASPSTGHAKQAIELPPEVTEAFPADSEAERWPGNLSSTEKAADWHVRPNFKSGQDGDRRQLRRPLRHTPKKPRQRKALAGSNGLNQSGTPAHGRTRARERLCSLDDRNKKGPPAEETYRVTAPGRQGLRPGHAQRISSSRTT